MPVESAADRLVFLDDADFGVAVTYTPAGGGAVALFALFDDPALQVVVGERAETIDARPTLLCRAADLPAGAAAGDAVAFTDPLSGAARAYAVASIEPDGQGMALVSLGAA